MEAKPLWVRDAKGKTWGPLAPPQLRVLFERKLIDEIAEASRDGEHFAPAADVPELSEAFVASRSPPAAAPVVPIERRAPTGNQKAWRPGAAPDQAEIDPLPAMDESSGLTLDPTSAFAGGPVEDFSSDPPVALQPVASGAPSEWMGSTPAGARLIQAVPPMGRIEEQSPFKLYYLLAASEASGMLVLGEGHFAISIWFKGGGPQAIESAELGLGQYLIEQRVLTAAQLASAAPQIKNAGGDVASGLFAAGLLNPQTAFPLIQQHAQSLLTRALLFEHGPFAYDPSVGVPASGFQMGQRWQLLAAAARKVDSIRLKRWIQGREGLVPRLAGSTAELQLTAQETRLVSQFDGRRTFSDSVEMAGPQSETVQRLAFFLTEIDRLMWDSAASLPAAPPRPPVATAPAPAVKPPVSSPPAAAPKPAASAAPRPASASKPSAPARPAAAAPKSPVAPKHAAAPVAQPQPQTNIPALRRFVEELRGQDHFARLKLERSKGPMAKLKPTYFQLAKIYHPDTVPPEGPEEARTLKAEILAFLNEAHGVLSDDAKRVHYLEELEAKEALGDVDIEAILAAEEDFQQAVALARLRKFSEALTRLEKCVAGNPKEGEFYAWRGYCRFFSAQDKKSQKASALEDQRTALMLNPRCLPAWLFQGQIHKLLNEVAEAKSAFQSALTLDPGNVEAQRELRLFETRKK